MFKTFFLILFLLFNSLGCSSQHQPPKKAKLANLTNKGKALDAYTWDFGQVEEGEVLRHSFELKNESKNVMNIKDTDTSCGCTASQAKKRRLMPGESTTIEVQFNSKGYSGYTSQFIYVHTDSLDNPIIRYIIKADVVKKYQSKTLQIQNPNNTNTTK